MGGIRRSRGGGEGFDPVAVRALVKQMLSGAEGDVLICNSNGVPLPTQVSGDLSMAASGHALISNNYVMNNFVFKERALGSLDGVNKQFSVLSWPLPNTECVFVDGVLQDPNSYVVNGSKIVFNQAPTGTSILVNYAVPSGGAGS